MQYKNEYRIFLTIRHTILYSLARPTTYPGATAVGGLL